MQLATRISALAYEKQEQEEMEENKKTQETCGFSQAASEDVFASQDEDIDMTLELINTQNFRSKKFEGHQAPVLNVALDPKAEFALSSACDGTAKLWKIDTQSCIKTWNGLWEPANDVCRSVTCAQVAWHPQGDFLGTFKNY